MTRIEELKNENKQKTSEIAKLQETVLNGQNLFDRSNNEFKFHRNHLGRLTSLDFDLSEINISMKNQEQTQDLQVFGDEDVVDDVSLSESFNSNNSGGIRKSTI